MTHTNIKTSVQIKLEIELEAWVNGEKTWKVNNQFDQSVLESALENFEAIDNIINEWEKDGTNLYAVGVMDWAYAISEFQPAGLHNEWID